MRKIIVLAVTAITLTACGGTASETASETSARATLPEAPSSSVAPSTTAEPTPTGPERNERGNIVKKMGQEGAFLDPEGNDLVVFAIDAIGPVQCTADWAEWGEEPENGHLIAADLRMATTPEFQGSLIQEYGFTVNPNDFQFVRPDGVTVSNLATMSTYGCIPDGETFTQNELNPASQYTGKVVLDVPALKGTLIYKPFFAEDGGWEWSF